MELSEMRERCVIACEMLEHKWQIQMSPTLLLMWFKEMRELEVYENVSYIASAMNISYMIRNMLLITLGIDPEIHQGNIDPLSVLLAGHKMAGGDSYLVANTVMMCAWHLKGKLYVQITTVYHKTLIDWMCRKHFYVFFIGHPQRIFCDIFSMRTARGLGRKNLQLFCVWFPKHQS